MNETIIKECILNLSIENYSSGPIPDTYDNGYIWIFGIDIDCVEIYIKVAIKEAPDGKKAVLISFHKAEYPLPHPFKEGDD